MATMKDDTRLKPTEPATVRRKLADAYDKLANGHRFTAAERIEFARIAEAWRATLK